MSLSNFAENLLLDWLLNVSATPTRPTGIWVALHIDNPGEDAADDEVTTALDANYSRKPVTFDPAADGSIRTDATVSWVVNANGSAYTVTHLSLWDAETGGNPLFYGTLVLPRTLLPNGILTFGSGDIVAALD